MNLRVHDRAGGVPQRRGVDQRPKRIRLGVDVGLPGQRRGEGLQLAQLPFGRAVDELHCARYLDVDLDPGFVHQLEAAESGSAFGEARLARPVDLLADALRQRLDEGPLVQPGIALQVPDDLGVVRSFACARRAVVLRRAEELNGARQHTGDERRREGQLVLDEALIQGCSHLGPGQ